MPRIEATRIVPVNVARAFALSQTYGEIRYRWDPFVAKQELLNGATKADKGVQVRTTSKHRLAMVSEYQSYRPPTHVGMKMIKGPWFFASFSGGWNFKELSPTETEATWRYNFVVRPAFIRPIADRIGSWLLQRDIDQRLDAFAKACTDPSIISAVQLPPTSLPMEPVPLERDHESASE